MKKKILSLCMAAAVAATVFVGCGTSKGEKNPEKMVFTYVTAPLNVPSIVEKEKGILQIYLKIWVSRQNTQN